MAKRPLISAYGTRLASPAKLPSDLNVCAARMKPVHAASASAPPTLMRRTPSAAISSTLQANVPNHEEVERLRRNRLDERLDFRGRSADPGRRARQRPLRRTPADVGRFAEGIGMADVVALGSCGQQHVLA